VPPRPSIHSGPAARESRGRRIVITTFGSLGDLHPYVALALGLKERGHQPVIATSAAYRAKIEALGIGFAPLRPDHPDWKSDPQLMKRVMNLRGGSEYVVRELFMPVLRETYDDTLAATRGADLLVSHPLTFTTPLIAEERQLPWASTMLSPLGFFSVYDPPVLPPAQFLSKLAFLGPRGWRVLFTLVRWQCHSWAAPYRQLRAELGLPPMAASPLFEGQHSPHLVLAMFPSLLARKQPDWPPAAEVTGYCFYDRDDSGSGLSVELTQFLDEGPAPIVFTLGSSAVLDAGPFYEISAQVARRLGRRAILLIGEDERNMPHALPAGVMACPYAPFSELFPRALAIVHQGGAGTTGQALRAGRPMLVMPYAHDQPDYARRVTTLGVARTVSRYRYTVERVTRELGILLDDPGYASRAAAAGETIRAEDGVRAACDALERLLPGQTSPASRGAGL
jgi:UDP:flavonoid glycosyltransferase YjiC (YdhE family)